MLLPTILPMAIAAFPWRLALRLTNNSGVEVPKATTVSPITRSETCNRRARDEAPSTSQPAPAKRSINPIASKIYESMAVKYRKPISCFSGKLLPDVLPATLLMPRRHRIRTDYI